MERNWVVLLIAIALDAGIAGCADLTRLNVVPASGRRPAIAQASSWEAWRRLVDAGNLGIFGPHRSLAS